MNRRMVNRLILAVSILLLSIGLYGIAPHLYGYIQGDSTYQNLKKFTHVVEEQLTSTKEATQDPQKKRLNISESEALQSPSFSFPAVDFSSLADINEHINGWIIISDTKINYPTVKGIDNIYYLDHMFDHKKNAAGSIFMDFENSTDFSDFHSIIYGHHMKNGSMFADIEKYKSQEFYDAHPEGKLITPDKNYRIHFISGYVANVMEDAWALEFQDEEQKKKWIEECMSKSDFKSNYTPKENDTFLTLSTCSYVFDDARYVLLGVLEEVK